jgi:hypothetical protein
MTTEPLHWHPASELPDADITVLCWLEPGGEWFSGWWDGTRWLDAASGGRLENVTHWASPEGPTALAAPVAQPATDDLPTPAMCRAAVIYANGPDIYERVPAEVTEIEEGIYAEVWKVMQSAAPVVAQPDCRTCQNVSIRSGGCSSVFLCVGASMYKPSPLVRYWKTKE